MCIRDRDTLLYYNLSHIAGYLSVSLKSMNYYINKLQEAGYRVSRTHITPYGIRTDAPVTFIHEIMKAGEL